MAQAPLDTSDEATGRAPFVGLRMTRAQRDRLVAAAAARDMTLSAYVRSVLESALDEDTDQEDVAEAS